MNEVIQDDQSRIVVAEQSYSKRGLPAVETPQATSLIQAIAVASANPNVDMDKMERLFAMHKQVVAMEAESAFNAAMARAQEKMLPAIANQRNTHTNSTYADLAAVAAAIRPYYTAEGISLSYDADRPVPGHDGNPLPPPKAGWFRTVALVSHSAGHSRLHHIDLPSDDVGVKGTTNKTPIQGVVSMTTYGRRVLECMVFNVSVKDGDGNAADSVGTKDKGDEPDPEGKTALEACASMRVLTETWNKLPKEKRATLSVVMNECRARIKAADKQP